ncbi:MAG: hypothetical protein WCB67_01505 [Solirubrobacteraceae bacterium]
MFVETDDYFAHQLVETHERVLLNDPSWAERVFFTVSHPDRFALDVGLSMYPNNDTVEAYAVGLLPGGRQFSMRAARDLSAGRRLFAGPIELEVLEPQRRWRLLCAANPSGIEFDLEYVARAAPYETRMPTLHRRGRLMYDNVIAFQPARYHGEVTLDGTRIAIDGVPGHRDRSWGVRASGEGRMRRGLVTTVFAEFDEFSILAMMYERFNGTPVKYAGVVNHDGGDGVAIERFEHDLVFDHDSRQLQEARFSFGDAQGRTWKVEAQPRMRLHLAGGGYTSDEHRRGQLGVPFWTERWNVDDPTQLRKIDQLNDNISHLRCGALTGHGVVETLLGEHDRYRVAPAE